MEKIKKIDRRNFIKLFSYGLIGLFVPKFLVPICKPENQITALLGIRLKADDVLKSYNNSGYLVPPEIADELIKLYYGD